MGAAVGGGGGSSVGSAAGGGSAVAVGGSAVAAGWPLPGKRGMKTAAVPTDGTATVGAPSPKLWAVGGIMAVAPPGGGGKAMVAGVSPAGGRLQATRARSISALAAQKIDFVITEQG